MAVIIIYLIMNIVRTYAIYNFVDNFLQKRQAPFWALFLTYGSYYSILAIFFLHPELFNPFYNIIINLVFVFLIGSLFYQATYWKCLICTVFIYILSIASEECTMVILLLIFKASLSDLLNNAHLIIMGIVISVFLLLIIVKLVNPLFKKTSSELSRLYWFAVFSIPSSCIYILHSLIRQLQQGKSDEFFVLITTVLLFSINILIFFLYDRLQQEETAKSDTIMLMQQNKAYEAQEQLVKNSQRDIRGLQHDLNNHITTLKALAESQKTDEFLKYLNDWSHDIVSIEPGLHIDNAVIKAMINSKLYAATLQDTALYANVDVPAKLNIPHTDLNVILGNLYDNALEACRRLPQDDRVIQSNIYYKHKTLIISVVNTYDKSTLNIHDGIYYTSKDDTEFHGLGLNQIQKITDKYDGIFQHHLSQMNGTDVFVAEVLLYLKHSPH